MATIKLASSKSCSRCINYAEKRAEVRDGVNCDANYAKSQMKCVRIAHNKDDKIQAHTIIQSFHANDAVSPQLANEIGCKLAREIAPDHQVAVYTHTDKDHVHNHIVINSVSLETGQKYHSDKGKIAEIRRVSDALCIKHGLSVVAEPAKLRYTMAEQAILASGKGSWKDEIRQAIDAEKHTAPSYLDFKEALQEKYGIVVNDAKKHITFTHPGNDRVVRGKTLGSDYEKDGIVNGIERQSVRRKQHSLGEIKREGGTREAGAGKPAAETGLGKVQRELREIADGVEGRTTKGREKQAEREYQATRARAEARQARIELAISERTAGRSRGRGGIERER